MPCESELYFSSALLNVYIQFVDISRCRLEMSAISFTIASSRVYKYKSKRIHAFQVASESPREHCEPFRSTSGSSSSDSSAANSTGLSVDSPIYPSLASSSSFLQASPSFYSTASPPTSLSPASPTGFLIPNLSHLPCNNSSCFSHARSNCSSLQCYSSGIQSDLSSGSPVTSSSSGSSVNNQPTDSQYLDIAVALRNIGADTIQRRIPSRDNSSPGDEPVRLIACR